MFRQPKDHYFGDKKKIATIISALCFAAATAPAFAGNTFGVDANGNVTIKLADSSFNQLTLTTGDNADELRYHLQDASGSTTAIDVLMGVTGNLLIRSFAGTDTIILDEVDLPGSVRIVTGSAADTIEIRDSSVAGTYTVISGSGSDSVEVSNSTHGKTRIVASSGLDAVTISDHTVSNGLIVNTGSDPDIVAINNLTASGTTVVATGAGNDDVAIEYAESAHRFVVNTSSDDDTVELSGMTLSGRAVFTLGEGDDFLSLGATVIQKTNPLFQGGNGDDTYEDDGANNLDSVNSRFVSFETKQQSNPTYVIGQTGPGGGTVFQIGDSGTTGLEIWRTDISPEQSLAAYGCAGTDVVGLNNKGGVSATTIEDQSGEEMTFKLAGSDCLTDNDAAALASNFSVNDTNDWHLPSASELLSAISELGRLESRDESNPNALFGYWSASEATSDNAFLVAEQPAEFSADAGSQSKNTLAHVLPVRSF